MHNQSDQQPLQHLIRAYRQGQLHHALLLQGCEGIGKRESAHLFATYCLCLQPIDSATENKPCKTCASCKLLEDTYSNTHPDFHIIRKIDALENATTKAQKERKLKTIPVDLLRSKLINTVGYTPQIGHIKIFVIEQAHELDHIGQNLLLKILEDPPARTYFILTTHQPSQLLPTVLSRVLPIKFQAIEDSRMNVWIQQNQTNPPLTAKQIDTIILLAQGSIKQAQEIIQKQCYLLFEQLEQDVLSISNSSCCILETSQKWFKEIELKREERLKAEPNLPKDRALIEATLELLGLLVQICRLGLRANLEHPQFWQIGISYLAQSQKEIESHLPLDLVLNHLLSQWASFQAGIPPLSAETVLDYVSI